MSARVDAAMALFEALRLQLKGPQLDVLNAGIELLRPSAGALRQRKYKRKGRDPSVTDAVTTTVTDDAQDDAAGDASLANGGVGGDPDLARSFTPVRSQEEEIVSVFGKVADPRSGILPLPSELPSGSPLHQLSKARARKHASPVTPSIAWTAYETAYR